MRVIALEKGARGVVKIGLDQGSLFLFRQAYLQPAERAENEPDDQTGDAIVALVSAAYASGTELAGPEWDTALARIERARDLYAVEKAALAILARREHSKAELLQKLTKKELPTSDSRIVLDRLETEGLLSDERFAEAWLRSRLRSHPEGEISLKAGLRAKGVEKGIAAQRIGSEREEVLRGLEKLAERSYANELRRAGRLNSSGAEKEDPMRRCYKKLRARGFSHADVKKALAKISGNLPNIDEGDDST
jgi:regulatory protein